MLCDMSSQRYKVIYVIIKIISIVMYVLSFQNIKQGRRIMMKVIKK